MANEAVSVANGNVIGVGQQNNMDNGHADNVPNGNIPSIVNEGDKITKTTRNPISQAIRNTFWLFRTVTIILVLSIIGTLKALVPSGFFKKKDVKDQVVLVTGAGSGMGRLMAERFAKLGAKLVLWDVNQRDNESTAKICQDAGAAAVQTFTCDVSKKNEVHKIADKVKEKMGSVDILINNAGIVSGKPILECQEDQMEKTMQVNCNAHFWTTKAFLGAMLEKDQGHIVQIVSAAGAFGVGGLTDYCASKFGAWGFSESLMAELHLKGSNVKMTMVCPCYVDTGMFDGAQMDSPTLLPKMTPDYVVNKTMDAILTNTPLLFLPRFVYLMYFFRGFLPVPALLFIGKELGVINSMEHFTGRKPENKAAVNGRKSPFKFNFKKSE